MLIKLKCKIGDDTKTALIRRESINCVVPFGEHHSHMYIENIATPLHVLVDFKTLEGFLASAFAEGVVGRTEMQKEIQA